MEPKLGWVWLSETERRSAEQALSDYGPDGTRDELGFSVIHFAYADRFFPGTSVQHTALRYVWFTCWSYLELQQRFAGGAFPRDELCKIEDRTGHKLIRFYGEGDGHGIIGGRVLRVGRSPVTKPSVVYWSAMRTWGLVNQLDYGFEAPGRGEVHARWDELSARRSRPEVDAEATRPLFVDPPPTPPRWRVSSEPLSFDLDPTHDEAARIRRAWARPKDHLGRTSLLSRLAERRRDAPPSMTSAEVLELCSADEQVSLRRAERAGAIAAIARALHTAMVQRAKDPAADLTTVTRRWLDDAVKAHSAAAAELDMDGLRMDVPEVGKLIELIESTKAWLAAGAGDFASLLPVYTRREMEQKPGRALLAPTGGDRRAIWAPRDLGPLTYRWGRVSGFLDQLAGR